MTWAEISKEKREVGNQENCHLLSLADAFDVAVCIEEEDELLSSARMASVFGLSSVEAERSREDWSKVREELVQLLGEKQKPRK